METYYHFIRTQDRKYIDPWLEQLDAAYYTGKSDLSDQNYDNMIKIYESRFGKREVVGSKPEAGGVMLPIAMMSLDKIMTAKELELFMNKNPGPYIVSDKVNGNASLIDYTHSTKKLYNRGDGTEGSDLSHMIPFLKLPTSTCKCYVKGELVITKKNYEPYVNEYKTNLSMINGLLNSLSADSEKLKLFDFIAYDLVSQEDNSSNMSETLKTLESAGFTIPFYVKVETLTIEILSEIFKKRKEEAAYDVDGLVIVANREVSFDERCIRKNPKYMIAFKEYGETAVAVVESIEWEASKNRLIKPTVKITPVTINSFTIKSLTAFNAGWIRDNNVGPGTELIITHNTIPHILSVASSTVASLPPEDLYPVNSWKWNETNVDIILLEENDEVRIAKIYEFFKQIDAKYCGEVTLAKLYHGGFNSVKKLIEAKKEDFSKNKIEGLGEGIYDRILKSISESLSNVTLPQIMSASCVFGIGFGVRKLVLITDTYPNILFRSPTLEQITSIKGFADKTAERFITGLPNFLEFIKDIPILSEKFLRPNIEKTQKTQEEKKITVENFLHSDLKTVETVAAPEPLVKLVILPPPVNAKKSEVKGKTIVFTGFRDKVLEKEISNLGGKVTTSVSKNTTCVVTGGTKGTGSSKETKAEELNIPIYSLKTFKNMYGL
jgi:NAD-dependent DNA ligase